MEKLFKKYNDLKYRLALKTGSLFWDIIPLTNNDSSKVLMVYLLKKDFANYPSAFIKYFKISNVILLYTILLCLYFEYYVMIPILHFWLSVIELNKNSN